MHFKLFTAKSRNFSQFRVLKKKNRVLAHFDKHAKYVSAGVLYGVFQLVVAGESDYLIFWVFPGQFELASSKMRENLQYSGFKIEIVYAKRGFVVID